MNMIEVFRLAIQPVAQPHDCLEPPLVGKHLSGTCTELRSGNCHHPATSTKHAPKVQTISEIEVEVALTSNM